jgi:hypothetical protein
MILENAGALNVESEKMKPKLTRKYRCAKGKKVSTEEINPQKI